MLNNCFYFEIQLTLGSVRFFALLVPKVLFNNGVESLDEVSFVLGKFMNIEENDVCFFFAGSVIFLNVNNGSEALVFVRGCSIIPSRMRDEWVSEFFVMLRDGKQGG